MNIVVVGGGPTGVELSGAIADMKKYVLPKDYPELDFSKMNIYTGNYSFWYESSQLALKQRSDQNFCTQNDLLTLLPVVAEKYQLPACRLL